MTAKEQLVKMVGKDDADKYIEMVKNMMQHEGQEEELKVVNE